MRIVVVGGSDVVENHVMTALHNAGHTAVAASPAFEMDAFTGEGLAEAMAGADAVVDVSDVPAWDGEKAYVYLTTVTRHVLRAGRRAGARHWVALSALGCDRLRGSAYMIAKLAQEELIRTARVPFTIVRATPSMEALARMAEASSRDDVVRVPDARVQPITSIELAGFVASAAADPPANGVVEIAGPEALTFEHAITRALTASGHERRVVVDRSARYLGAPVRDDALLPGPGARIGAVRLSDWARRYGHEAAAA